MLFVDHKHTHLRFCNEMVFNLNTFSMADVNSIKNHVRYQLIFARFILYDYNGLGVKAVRAVTSYKVKIKIFLDESHKIFKCKYMKRYIKQTMIFYEYLIKALEVFFCSLCLFLHSSFLWFFLIDKQQSLSQVIPLHCFYLTDVRWKTQSCSCLVCCFGLLKTSFTPLL